MARPANPNALTPEEAAQFLAEIKKSFPQFYALALLGFVTGLRPSSLRPLRRRGSDANIDWKEGVLRVRRSHSRRPEIMKGTKQRTNYRIGLPPVVMGALEGHVESLKGVRSSDDCELLFPSRGSKTDDGTPWMISRSALDKPFKAVSKTLGLDFELTPKGMRRTFQDLCRSVGVKTELQQAICGHIGKARRDDEARMTKLCSTYRANEMRAAIAKIVAAILPTARRRRAA
jgi:integrase